MAVDLTSSFRAIYESSQPIPDRRKRRRPIYHQPSPSSSSSLPPPSAEDEPERDEFLREAYTIHAHIRTLVLHLDSIRRQYLTISPPTSSVSSLSFANKGKAREGGSSHRAFTDKERDEVDLQAKIVLKQCLERTLALERAEEEQGGFFRRGKGKGKKGEKDAPSTSTRLINLLLPPSAQTSLSSLLPLNSPSQHHTTLLKAHHASILFSLHASLTSAGSTLSDLQEDRAKRLAEASSRSLGGGLAFLMGESESGGTGGLGAGQGRGQGAGGIIVPKAPVRQEEEGEKALSQEQMMLFESENARLLEGYNDHLEQIQKTQKTLLQISTLQSLLSQSLMTQAETSDRLLLEAGQGVSDVRAGNAQLVKAKERGGSGRVMVLTFLIGAALALLFLDWYS